MLRPTLCCLCLYFFALSCLGQGPQTDSPNAAVVHIRVNTAYDDSNESLRMLETLARYAPVRQIIVAPGDTLSGLFVREYGFGIEDLPKSYSLLLRFILEKNHLSRPEDLLPGNLIIPAVPRRVLTGFNRDNPLNKIANMTIFRSQDALASSTVTNRSPERAAVSPMESVAPDIAYKDSVRAGGHRPTAPFEVLTLELGLKPATSLIESTAFPTGAVTWFTAPIQIRLASDGKCDTEPGSMDHQTLTQEQKTTISELLKVQSQRATVLFILDTGWPSLSAYMESREALYDVLDSIWRAKFGVSFPKAQVQKTIPSASNEHCRCIERALRELQILDKDLGPTKRIRVIYIPLTREQGASTILTDLLQTSDLLQRQEAESTSVNWKTIRGSRDYAKSLVSSHFPAQWSGEQVQTDKSVMDAILLIGQVYAEISKTVFFASESWTVPHGGKYYVQYQTPQFGMVTSAAGNDGTTELLDFAQRSASTKDTMAIINMSPVGLDPGSTRIEERNIDIAMAAGFDGQVTDDVSGTSFSAPRVAWFLAAGEAVRNKKLDQREWGIELMQNLKDMRDPRAIGYEKLLFNPLRYIEAQAKSQ